VTADARERLRLRVVAKVLFPLVGDEDAVVSMKRLNRNATLSSVSFEQVFAIKGALSIERDLMIDLDEARGRVKEESPTTVALGGRLTALGVGETATNWRFVLVHMNTLTRSKRVSRKSILAVRIFLAVWSSWGSTLGFGSLACQAHGDITSGRSLVTWNKAGTRSLGASVEVAFRSNGTVEFLDVLEADVAKTLVIKEELLLSWSEVLVGLRQNFHVVSLVVGEKTFEDLIVGTRRAGVTSARVLGGQNRRSRQRRLDGRGLKIWKFVTWCDRSVQEREGLRFALESKLEPDHGMMSSVAIVRAIPSVELSVDLGREETLVGVGDVNGRGVEDTRSTLGVGNIPTNESKSSDSCGTVDRLHVAEVARCWRFLEVSQIVGDGNGAARVEAHREMWGVGLGTKSQKMRRRMPRIVEAASLKIER
jgi:hypothetical protein